MKFILFVGAICLVVSHSKGRLINRKPIVQKQDGISRKLDLVATVDGKSFFVGTSTMMNWTEASDFCTGNEMRLASVTSVAQSSALQATTVAGFLNGLYWTSGRDSQKITQYRWNGTDTELSESVLFIENNYEYLNCIWFYRYYGTASFLCNYPCSRELYALCET